jgi:hypothetical protein
LEPHKNKSVSQLSTELWITLQKELLFWAANHAEKCVERRVKEIGKTDQSPKF